MMLFRARPSLANCTARCAEPYGGRLPGASGSRLPDELVPLAEPDTHARLTLFAHLRMIKPRTLRMSARMSPCQKYTPIEGGE